MGRTWRKYWKKYIHPSDQFELGLRSSWRSRARYNHRPPGIQWRDNGPEDCIEHFPEVPRFEWWMMIPQTTIFVRAADGDEVAEIEIAKKEWL